MPRSVSKSLCLVTLALLTISCGPKETICKKKFSNGSLEYEVPCIGGVFNGEYREYNRAGDLWITKTFVKGVEVDTTRYYYSRTGEILKEIPMRLGEKHGLAKEYYKDGNLKRVQQFSQGVRNGEDATYYPRSTQIHFTKTYRGGVPEGDYRRYTPDGKTALEGQYAQGKASGEWKHYYPSGKLKAQWNYRTGMAQGDFLVLRLNGQPYLKGSFRDGLVNGTVNYHDSRGNASYQERWSRGVNLEFDQASGLESSYPDNKAAFWLLKERTYLYLSPDSVMIGSRPLTNKQF